MVKRVAIIGNGGGGKTTLAKAISARKSLPLLHVDSIQFLPNWGKRGVEETRQLLDQEAQKIDWVIDGFGPMDSIEERIKLADKVIFVDMPLWHHYWWAFKRCMKAYKKDREELPKGCSEKGFRNMWRLFRIMWHVHHNVRPELCRIMSHPKVKDQVLVIRNMSDWNRVYHGDLN